MKDVARQRPDKPLRPLADLLWVARQLEADAAQSRKMGDLLRAVPVTALEDYARQIRDAAERLVISTHRPRPKAPPHPRLADPPP